MKARISYEFFKEQSFYNNDGVEFRLYGFKDEEECDIIWDITKHYYSDYHYECEDILVKSFDGSLVAMPIHSRFVYLIEDTPKYTEFLNKLEELY